MMAAAAAAPTKPKTAMAVSRERKGRPEGGSAKGGAASRRFGGGLYQQAARQTWAWLLLLSRRHVSMWEPLQNASSFTHLLTAHCPIKPYASNNTDRLDVAESLSAKDGLANLVGDNLVINLNVEGRNF
mmetsp:Transcript_12055/g.19598  ORF Transcript_12055/g.19598 Transcript_12055/m.19598 type:complete len:129 (-) Transcript_12055:399-785(-)